MNKKIWYLISLLLIIFSGLVLINLSKQLFIPKKVHYHAGFVVFQNNKKLDFSDYKYMNIEPCALKRKEDNSPNAIQLEKAHLHDGVGDLVHIERDGAEWKDLFTNIHFPIDSAIATGYINGKIVNGFQSQRIYPYESIVIFIGKNDPKYLKEAVTKSYILRLEKKSVDCGE